jgi:hypothetical protein
VHDFDDLAVVEKGTDRVECAVGSPWLLYGFLDEGDERAISRGKDLVGERAPRIASRSAPVMSTAPLDVAAKEPGPLGRSIRQVERSRVLLPFTGSGRHRRAWMSFAAL